MHFNHCNYLCLQLLQNVESPWLPYLTYPHFEVFFANRSRCKAGKNLGKQRYRCFCCIDLRPCFMFVSLIKILVTNNGTSNPCCVPLYLYVVFVFGCVDSCVNMMFSCWVVDIQSTFCRPYNTPHVFFHIRASVTLVFIYIVIRLLLGFAA